MTLLVSRKFSAEVEFDYNARPSKFLFNVIQLSDARQDFDVRYALTPVILPQLFLS